MKRGCYLKTLSVQLEKAMAQINDPSNYGKMASSCQQPNMERTELSPLTAFLKAKYPRCIPLPLVKNTKKPALHFDFAIDKISDEDMWKQWEDAGRQLVESGECDVGISIRDHWIVIDFDDKERGEYMSKQDEFKDTVCVETEKGFHFYFEKTAECANWVNTVKPFKINDDVLDIDIISTHANGTGGIITIPPSKSKKWINRMETTAILPMSTKFIDWAQNSIHFIEKGEVILREKVIAQNPLEFAKIEKAVMALDAKRATGFGEWRNVCWAILNECERSGLGDAGEDLVHDFSAKCKSKYRPREVQKFIKNWSYREHGYNFGTIMKALKVDNRSMFDEMNEDNTVKLNGYSFVDDEQIDIFDGEERPYQKVKEIFESTRFKIKNPICYCESCDDGNIIIRNEEKMFKTYRNLYCTVKVQGAKNATGDDVVATKKFMSVWMDDASIRTYDGMETYPPPKVCPPRVYNLWNGFAVERLQCESSHNVDIFLEHVDVLCNYDKKVAEFVLLWLGDFYQRPGKINGISLVFRSKPRAGKNIFWNVLMRKLVGADKYKETANPIVELFNRFSGGRFRRFMINIDELKAKDGLAISELLKNAITSDKYNHEIKGVDPMETNNFNRFIFTTNKDLSVKVDEGDGRFVVISVSNDKIGDKAYFDRFIDYINDDRNLKAIHEYLLNVDTRGVNWQADRPETSLYCNLQTLNVDFVIQFLINITKIRMADGYIEVSAGEVCDMFKKWSKNNHHSKAVGDTYEPIIPPRMLWMKLTLLADESGSGVRKTKGRTQNMYGFQPLLMKEHFMKEGTYDMEFNFSELEFMGQWRGS